MCKYVYDHHMTEKTKIRIETLAGIKELDLTVENGKVSMVKVDMGAPIFAPTQIPVISDAERVVNMPIEVDGETYAVTCVSMGNPHAVVFVEDTKSLKLEDIGPKFEHHAMFPERINTEFVQILSRNEMNMRVWERGSGETYACGTGTCASVVAAVINGLTDHHVKVHLLGGDLEIDYDEANAQVMMIGPAVTVYTGEIEI